MPNYRASRLNHADCITTLCGCSVWLYINIEALCAAPPEALPPQPEPNATELPSSALGPRNTSPRRRVVDLQAAAPSPTPTRRTPRRAEDRAPPRPRPPARALAHLRTPKETSHVAGLQTSPRCRRELRTSVAPATGFGRSKSS